MAQNVLSFGAFTAMLQLLNLLRNPVVGLSGMFGRISGMEVSAERLTELLKPAQCEEPVRVGQVHAVVFDQVRFAYPGDEQPVLENFSARFSLEGWTCLTGVSGRGKTTMFKLMLGLYSPQSGSVYLETEAGNVPCSMHTRHLFAYVPQDYVLLSGTVLDNLLLVAPDASQQQRRNALHLAQADFIWDLAAGEKTPVRENNAGLSKGQLQRLAIARAILMDRPIFLLDECTSALDAQSEGFVLQSLHSTGKQAILVSHHPDALSDLENIRITQLDT